MADTCSIGAAETSLSNSGTGKRSEVRRAEISTHHGGLLSSLTTQDDHPELPHHSDSGGGAPARCQTCS